MHSMTIQMELFKMKKIEKEKTNLICVNHLFCTYCKKYMHTIEECLEKKIDEEQRQYEFKKSNIPEKYWKSNDPVKSFLMNNSIKGYKNRIYWEKRNT